MTSQTRPADKWGPLYFLASVGAGGLVATFFMWLYMWVPHPDQPVPLFEDIARAWGQGDPLMQTMIAVALAGIATMAFLNIKLFIWNVSKFAAFQKTEAYLQLRRTNAQTQLLAFPLAIAMMINVGFILGMVFVPGLWSVVEYLFPAAMAAFLVTGLLALKQIGDFLGRVLGEGGFDWKANNSFAQVLPAFALAMTGVGLSASSALSVNPVTAGIGLVLATVFLVISSAYAAIAVVLGLASMLQNGTNPETAPTITIIVPLMTVLGILMLRLDHGMHVHFGSHAAPGETLMMLTQFLAMEIAFGLLGIAVLAKQGYFGRFVTGKENSVGTYALVCPGVAFAVLMQFFINKGLVGAGIIAKFGVAYWSLSAVAVAFQLAMIALVLVLNRRHFRGVAQVAQAAA